MDRLGVTPTTTINVDKLGVTPTTTINVDKVGVTLTTTIKVQSTEENNPIDTVTQPRLFRMRADGFPLKS